MLSTIDQDSRLIDVTLGELADYLRACGFMCATDVVAAPKQDTAHAPRPELIGIKGLAEYLRISENTASKYYHAGVFDSAVVKLGARNLRFDRELASAALKKNARRR